MRSLVIGVVLLAWCGPAAWATLPIPLLYLPFDDERGDIAADRSGRGNDATLFGATKWIQRPGDKGGAVEFGEGAWGEVPHDDAFHLTTAMTLACWARIDGDFGHQQMAIEKGPVWGPGEYSLLPDFEDRTLFQANDLPEGCDDELRGPSVIDGEWHHIAGTYDGVFLHLGVSSIRCKRPSHVTGILSPNMMANRLSASFQFWTGRVHLFEARCIAR